MSRRRIWGIVVVLVFSVALIGVGVYAVGRFLHKESVTAETPAIPSSQVDSDPQALARRAGNVLQQHCHRCHGQDGAMEGGFNYVMDRQRLVDRHKIVPGNAEQSKLLRRVLDGEMPPEDEKQRPSTEEVAVLRRWIEEGAPEFGPAKSQRKTTNLAGIPRLIRNDLARLSERDRRFIRYFTLTHLYNAALADDELQSYRQALSKLVNSLSWGREIVVPQAVDAEKTVFRIDLRDFKWDGATWERLLAEYPYGSVSDDDVCREIIASTDCRLPHVRADWFTSVASRPPLYYDLLQMPVTERELENLLRVDAAKDIRGERVVRAGFSNSGVSRNNRVIERYESAYGAYWKSYDFAGGTGTKNIFASPLGPGGGPNSFQADGGELIYELPNGLHAYLLVDSSGKRIDQAPTAIVSAPRRPERAVVAGLSCMSCHSRGLNDKSDQIREHVQKNPDAFPQAEAASILALYAPRERFEKLLRGDIDRYRKSLEKTGTRWGISDPIETLTARFEAEVDLPLAAAEVGVSTKELGDVVARTPELGRALGALRSRGGTVPRRLFADSFGELLRALRRGEPLRPGTVLPLPPALKERTEYNLPEGFTDVKTGGGGRFLIFYLKKAKKLAIFDIPQVKIVHEIEIPSDDVRFAAGREKLMVVLRGEKVVQRWDLRTFKREKTVPVPGGMSVWKTLMGYTSKGPLALWGTGDKVALMDVERMEAIDTDLARLTGTSQWGFDVRVSPDGQTFITWHNGLSPSNFGVVRVVGGNLTGTGLGGGGLNENWIQPNADGSLLMHNSGRVYSGDLKAHSADGLIGRILMPADDPRFFLAARGLELAICTSADRKPIFTIREKALQGLNRSSSPPRWYHHSGEPRIHFLPQASLLAILTQDDKRIVVRPFNLIEELEKAGKEYLFVLSLPKTHAKVGVVYQYQMEVKSKSAGVTYKLETAPDGMTLSARGELRWNVPQTLVGKSIPVIINVKNAAGKEQFHTFDLEVD